MAKVTIRNAADAAIQSTDALGAANGKAQVRPLVADAKDPLHLYYVDVGAGEPLQWDKAGDDWCGYVLAGEIAINGRPLDNGGSFVVEHGADARIEANQPARIALFGNRRVGAKPGGRVHILASDRVPNNEAAPHPDDIATSSMHADAHCAGCDLWLHGNHFQEGAEVALHSHSEDEIILVLGGEILLGSRPYGPDTAVAVAKDTVYGFRAGKGGMKMINFRVGVPSATSAKTGVVMNEAEFFLSRTGRPEPLTI
jgi:hypothetical protein